MFAILVENQSCENKPWDRIPRDSPWEEEVPETRAAIVLKGVEVGVGTAEVVELHELVGWGLDEKGADHLSGEENI